MTLNQFAAKIANIVKQSFNHEFKERIKDSYKLAIATFIRRSVADHGIDANLKLSYIEEIIELNEIPNDIKPFIGTGTNYDKCFRSKTKIPRTVRFANDSPLTKVSSIDGVIYSYSPNLIESTFIHSIHAPINKYTMINDYLYIVTKDRTPKHILEHTINKDKNGFVDNKITSKKNKLKYIIVESIFLNPEEVITKYDYINDGQDIDIPIPEDAIQDITAFILKTEFGIIPPEITEVKSNTNPNIVK